MLERTTVGSGARAGQGEARGGAEGVVVGGGGLPAARGDVQGGVGKGTAMELVDVLQSLSSGLERLKELQGVMEEQQRQQQVLLQQRQQMQMQQEQPMQQQQRQQTKLQQQQPVQQQMQRQQQTMQDEQDREQEFRELQVGQSSPPLHGWLRQQQHVRLSTQDTSASRFLQHPPGVVLPSRPSLTTLTFPPSSHPPSSQAPPLTTALHLRPNLQFDFSLFADSSLRRVGIPSQPSREEERERRLRQHVLKLAEAHAVGDWALVRRWGKKVRGEASAEGDAGQRVAWYMLQALDARADGTAAVKWRAPIEFPVKRVAWYMLQALEARADGTAALKWRAPIEFPVKALEARADGTAAVKWRAPIEFPVKSATDVMAAVGHSHETDIAYTNFAFAALLHEIPRVLFTTAAHTPPAATPAAAAAPTSKAAAAAAAAAASPAPPPRRIHLVVFGMIGAPQWASLLCRIATACGFPAAAAAAGAASASAAASPPIENTTMIAVNPQTSSTAGDPASNSSSNGTCCMCVERQRSTVNSRSASSRSSARGSGSGSGSSSSNGGGDVGAGICSGCGLSESAAALTAGAHAVLFAGLEREAAEKGGTAQHQQQQHHHHHHTPPPPLSIRVTGINGGTVHLDSAFSASSFGHQFFGQLAKVLGLPVTFEMVDVPLESLHPGMVKVQPGEEVVVISLWTLMLFPDDSVLRHNPRDAVLKWIQALKPRLVLLAEVDAALNGPFFLARVRETFRSMLAFISAVHATMPDSSISPIRFIWETLLFRELINCVGCEGIQRLIRAERLEQWQERMGRLGFEEVGLGREALAAMRGTTEGRDGRFEVVSVGGAARLMWKGQPLLAVSAWR
ncbi:unnamed protein product [Closterium sp. NIES-54]